MMIEIVLKNILFYLLTIVIVCSYWIYVSKKYKNINILFLVGMFFYRLPFMYLYHEVIVGDWIVYINILERVENIQFGLGTKGVTWLASFFRFFELSALDFFYLYSLFGYFAVCIFYTIINSLIEETGKIKVFNVNIFPWILLYPSLHMYTIMLGKDPVVIYGIALATLGLSKLKINWFYVILGVVLTTLVRSHMGAVLAVCILGSLLFNNNYNSFQKGIVLSIIVMGAVIIIPQIAFIFRIQDVSFAGVLEAIEKNEGYVHHASTHIDMSSYPAPLRMFTYLFRPLFIDSPNLLLLEYSLENFIFLMLLIINLRLSFFSWLKKQPIVIKFSFIYFFLGSLVLCHGLSLFGLFIRQKTMVFLNFILLLFVFINYHNNLNSKKIENQ